MTQQFQHHRQAIGRVLVIVDHEDPQTRCRALRVTRRSLTSLWHPVDLPQLPTWKALVSLLYRHASAAVTDPVRASLRGRLGSNGMLNWNSRIA
jgi:hypothetical protein